MSFIKLQYKKLPQLDLITKAQNGDHYALEELIRREQKNIFATFSYLAKKPENINDLTQEALLRIVKGIVNLRNPKNFKSWSNQIVTNVFYDDLRKLNRQPKIISLDEDDSPFCQCTTQIPDKKRKPSEVYMTHELNKKITTEIQHLPENFKVAIILRELQGLSYEQIAEATNTSIGTVKSRIARARYKLQECLSDYL